MNQVIQGDCLEVMRGMADSSVDAVQPFLPLSEIIHVKDGHPLAVAIANRHYSRRWKGNLNQPRLTLGQRMILISPYGDWLFVWNFLQFRKDGQTGACCVLFRNESNRLSSEIILKAEHEWDEKYGPCRKFTYVHPGLIKSHNPGFCFQKAGWTKAKKRSQRGLVLLHKECSIGVKPEHIANARSEKATLEQRVAWLETQVQAQGAKLKRIEATQQLSLWGTP